MRHGPHPLVAHLVLGTLAALFAAPLAWMVLTSLKTEEQISAEPHRVLPRQWRAQNYVDAV